MTIPEIQALREELEDALQTAFADFKRLSGVAIVAVQVTPNSVTVQLEPL